MLSSTSEDQQQYAACMHGLERFALGCNLMLEIFQPDEVHVTYSRRQNKLPVSPAFYKRFYKYALKKMYEG